MAPDTTSSPSVTIPRVSNGSEDLAQIAVDCYFAAMLAMAQAAAEICPHLGVPYQSGLVRLRRRLAFETNTRNLTDSITAMETDLAAFSRRVHEYYSLKCGDVSTLLEIVAHAVETCGMRDRQYLDRLGLLVQQMENGLQNCQDPNTLRALYEHQLAHIRTFLERLSSDNKTVFSQLHADIATYEERLLRAEVEASLDPLTQLVNRRELERLIRDRIARGTMFSILLFDIRSLHSINERFGHDAGDQVLRQFGERLVAQVRPRDIVARWGGDEFGVIFDCGSAAANSRAHQIAQWVSGRYAVSVNGHESKPELTAEVYVIEHRNGEDENAFVKRVQEFRVISSPQPVEIPAAPDDFSPERWRRM